MHRTLYGGGQTCQKESRSSPSQRCVKQVTRPNAIQKTDEAGPEAASYVDEPLVCVLPVDATYFERVYRPHVDEKVAHGTGFHNRCWCCPYYRE